MVAGYCERAETFKARLAWTFAYAVHNCCWRMPGQFLELNSVTIKRFAAMIEQEQQDY
jgi:hypothetical protein